MDSREYDALRAAVALRGHLPRKPRSLNSDAAAPAALREAEKDFAEALQEHRRELTEGVDALLSDPIRCAVQARSARILTLTPSDADLLLQTLNDLRVSAWERLGCPDFEAGDRPEVTDDNFLCLWALQVTDLFLSFLLTGLHGET